MSACDDFLKFWKTKQNMGYSHNTGQEGKKSEDCFSFLPAREFSIRIENAGADCFVMRILRINENFNLKIS